MSPKLEVEIRKAKKGDPEAQFAVAEAYRTGKGVDEDFAEALYWYRAAAEQGNVSAQNNLGTMFQRGIGTEKNPKLAVYWYRQAAEAGDEVAQFNLAMRYARGDGVEQNDTEAAHWFAKSADQGYTEAIGELGTMYRFGRGVPQDIAAAARYHTTAARNGDVTSIGNLLGYQGEIESAALSGSAVAALCLAEMHGNGVPVEKDLAQAYAWLGWARRLCERDDDATLRREVDIMYLGLTASLSEADQRRGEDLLKALALGQATSQVEPMPARTRHVNGKSNSGGESPADLDGLDPRKFENDFDDGQEESDDEGFEGIYGSGLRVPETSSYYEAWCAWLKANHPDDPAT